MKATNQEYGMAVPTTNLFRGDRVRLSQSYITSQEIVSAGIATRNNGPHTLKDKIGTIVSDTCRPDNHYIHVHWDGNKGYDRKYGYMPCDLVLVEEDVVPNITSGGERRRKLAKLFMEHA
jgi:hypothetical protein